MTRQILLFVHSSSVIRLFYTTVQDPKQYDQS